MVVRIWDLEGAVNWWPKNNLLLILASTITKAKTCNFFPSRGVNVPYLWSIWWTRERGVFPPEYMDRFLQGKDFGPFLLVPDCAGMGCLKEEQHLSFMKIKERHKTWLCRVERILNLFGYHWAIRSFLYTLPLSFCCVRQRKPFFL